MDRNEINTCIINYLRNYKPEKIGIFGSFARNEQQQSSDIDILVKFRESISLLDLARIRRELTDLLGIKVDIITEASIKNKRLKKYIYKDLKVILDER